MWQVYKEIKRDISIVPTLIFTFKEFYWKKWDRISDNLYVSKLPFRSEEKSLENFSKKNQEIYNDKPIGLVVSVVERYEIKKSIFFGLLKPIRKNEWEAKGVTHLLLSIEDFTSTVDVQKAVKFVLIIQAYLQQKKAVLVHCKAGRSRSPMVVASVLAFDYSRQEAYKNYSSEKLIELAINKFTESRRHINLSKDNIATAIKIVEETRSVFLKNPDVIDDFIIKETLRLSDEQKEFFAFLKNQVDTCCAEESTKKELCELESYLKLVEYKNKLLKDKPLIKSFWGYPERVKHIDKMLSEINEAKNGQWYADLVQLSGPASDLLSATPIFMAEDQKTRETLVQNFKKDVEKVLCNKLKCPTQDLSELYSLPEEKLKLSPKGLKNSV